MCPNCENGIIRTLGRDNDEIITDCPCTTMKNNPEFYDPDRAQAAAELWEKLASFEGEDADAQLMIEKAMSEYACTADKRIEDSDWAQQYKAACIQISYLHEALEEIENRLKQQVEAGTGTHVEEKCLTAARTGLASLKR